MMLSLRERGEVSCLESGQALLIVILVMTVSLTVGLASVTRSIVNVRIATQEEQSQRAFSAAEAGIEQTLKSCTGSVCPTPIPPVDIGTRATYNVQVSQISGGTILINGGNIVPQDEGAQVLLVAFDRLYQRPFDSSGLYQGRLTVFWGNPAFSDCQNAALEIVLIRGSPSSASTYRYAADACAAGRNPANNFSAPTSIGETQVLGKNFKYQLDLLPESGQQITDGLLVRVIPVYSSTQIAVQTNQPGKGRGDCGGVGEAKCLPLQGAEITSTGKTLETPEIQRKIRVFNSFPALPSALFNYALFSGGADLSAEQ